MIPEFTYYLCDYSPLQLPLASPPPPPPPFILVLVLLLLVVLLFFFFILSSYSPPDALFSVLSFLQFPD